MNDTDADFRPGDKIRITHEITVDRMGETCGDAAYAREGGLYMWNRSHSSVELIERKDDPSKDLVGTVRRLPSGVVVAKKLWASGSTGWIPFDVDGVYQLEWRSAGEIIGAVPGTSAYDSWQVACETYEEGFAAGKAAAAEKQAAGQVKDKLGRSLGHEFEASYSGMVCGRMVMRNGYGDQCGEPADAPVHERPLWTGDGSEEPPAHVKAVRDDEGDMARRCAKGGWRWTPDADDVKGSGWRWRYMKCDGSHYVEVVE